MKKKIGVIDYGIGNWASVSNILLSLGFKPIITSVKSELEKTNLIILPGVGAFKPAMQAIEERGLNKVIYELVDNKKPLLGICLGMQLLGRSSLENEYTNGLGLIPEDVYPLGKDLCHIGWNSLNLVKEDKSLGIFNNSDFYFNHSYVYKAQTKYSIGETSFNSTKFTSILRKKNIYGLQFHPEKSQTRGLSLLKNLISSLI